MAIVTLIEAQPWDPVTGAVVPVRLAGGGGRHYRHKGFSDWRAGVVAPPRVTEMLEFDGGFTGGAIPSTTAIGFVPALDRVRAAIARLMWVGAPITVSTGDDAATLPSWTVELTGKVAGYAVQRGGFTFTVASLAGRLGEPLVTATFAGTGGIEGGAAAAGRLKRRAWGRCWNVEGRLLDASANLYEFGDPAHPLQGFDRVKDKGRSGPLVEIGWQGSVAATFAALKAASAPAGGAAVAPSIACAKWWTQPAVLSADLRGEIGSGYGETVAEIAASVSLAAGGPAVTGLAAAITSRPNPAGLLVEEAGERGVAVLDRLLLRASLAWGITPAGSLSIVPLAFADPVATITAREVEREAAFAPVTAVRIGWRRNHRLLAPGDISAAVTAEEVIHADGTTAETLKPAEAGATNSADPKSPFGGGTVGGTVKKLDDFDKMMTVVRARQDVLEKETIPTIDKAVSDAGNRIAVAQKAADDGLKAAGANAKTIIDLRSTLASAFALVSRGLSTPLAGRREAGIYNAAGAQVMTANRGWNVVTWTADNAIASVKTFDTLGGLYDGGVAAMVAYLNGLADGTTITVHTFDEPHTNHMLPALVAAMQRCGAGEGFTSPDWQYRGAYVLIGQAGVGRGNGDELYRGSPGGSEGPTDAYIDKPFSLLKGKPQRIGLGTAVDSQIRQVATTAANAEKAVAGLSTSVDTSFKGVNETLGRYGDSITALSDADKGFASRAATLEASARAPSGRMLNANATFYDLTEGDGSTGSQQASGWSYWWSTPDWSARRVGHVGPWAWALRANADHVCGLSGQRFVADPGWYILDIAFELLDGGFSGAGVFLSLANAAGAEIGFPNISLSTLFNDPDQSTPGTPFRLIRRTKLMKLEGDFRSVAIVAAHNSVAFGEPLAFKVLSWHHIGIRPASDVEIRAQKAITDTLPAVSARIKKTEDTLVDLPNRYAAASRADLLEAQVNGETGSRLLSRAESKATALVDGLNGAVNGRMDIMVSEYNGIGAALKQQSGTLAGVDGRTAVYWEVLGTTSDGKTRVRLSKSNGSRGIFYVDADMVVDGNLLVTGTLPLNALQRGQYSRYAEQHWSGDVSPFPGQKQTLIDTSMPGIGAGGSFTWEAYVDFVTNEGKREVQGNYNNSGYPLYTDYRADGGIGINLMNGGATVISDVNPRTNRGYGRVVVYGGGAFDGRLLADIFNNSYDSGVIRDGDYFRREVSATYRVYSVMIKVRWTFI